MAKAKSSVGMLASAPLSGSEGSESKSITVRPIENGFICCESHSKADGSYEYSERFYSERPKISESAGARSGAVGSESLSDAKAALK